MCFRKRNKKCVSSTQFVLDIRCTNTPFWGDAYFLLEELTYSEFKKIIGSQIYSIVTRQKFSNFGYFRNKSHELSMSKMKKVIHLYLYFMALYMHILLNCVCYQISYFFLLLLFISSCSSYYFYCGMKKLSRHSIFDHFHAFHSCTVLFHRFLRQLNFVL